MTFNFFSTSHHYHHMIFQAVTNLELFRALFTSKTSIMILNLLINLIIHKYIFIFFSRTIIFFSTSHNCYHMIFQAVTKQELFRALFTSKTYQPHSSSWHPQQHKFKTFLLMSLFTSRSVAFSSLSSESTAKPSTADE